MNSLLFFLVHTIFLVFPCRFVTHEYDDFVALKKLQNGELDGVFFTNDVTVNYYNLINKSWRQVRYTRDVVRLHTPVFYFRKTSILTSMFDQKIEICNESGLTIHWVEKYKEKSRQRRYRKPTKLEVANIMAILQISAFMYLIASIVYAMEIFSHRNECVRKVLDFFTY